MTSTDWWLSTSTEPPEGPTFWRRAPGWIFHGCAALGALALLWSESYPIVNVALWVLAFYWIGASTLIWLVRLTSYLIGLRSPNPSGPWWPLLVAPAAGAFVLAVVLAGLPLTARWSLSESSFDARADAALAEAPAAGAGDMVFARERVGLYHVDSATVDADGNVFFAIAGSGFIDGGGFARLPRGVPTSALPNDFEHIGGDWYLYVVRF